jgi:hypothetical protein
MPMLSNIRSFALNFQTNLLHQMDVCMKGRQMNAVRKSRDAEIDIAVLASGVL